MSTMGFRMHSYYHAVAVYLQPTLYDLCSLVVLEKIALWYAGHRHVVQRRP